MVSRNMSIFHFQRKLTYVFSEKEIAFHLNNLIGWYWSIASGEKKNEKAETFQADGRMDEMWSANHMWAFSSDELKRYRATCPIASLPLRTEIPSIISTSTISIGKWESHVSITFLRRTSMRLFMYLWSILQ